MSTTATRKPKLAEPRKLLEWSASADATAPALKIDREKKVIYGVKVLGRFSRNSHGMNQATGGTEYSLACMRDALPLYEGCEVLSKVANHNGPDGAESVIGALRNARIEGDAIRADLHYYDSHPMSARVLEDVERQIGAIGLSHNAADDPRKARFDSGSRRLVIEKLVKVNSVDLVRRPASNRNLWESQDAPMNTTLRKLLEDLKLTPARDGWRKRLLEDDAMAGPLDAPAEVADGADGVASGIKSACMAIIDDDSLDAAGKIAKLKTLLTAHEKLSAAAEPEAVKEDESEKKEPKDADKDKSESEKALAAENAKLKHGLAVRKLCEELKITPDAVLLESAEALPDIKAVRKLLEREKARGAGPRSSPPPAPAKKPADTNRPFADRIRA